MQHGEIGGQHGQSSKARIAAGNPAACQNASSRRGWNIFYLKCTTAGGHCAFTAWHIRGQSEQFGYVDAEPIYHAQFAAQSGELNSIKVFKLRPEVVHAHGPNQLLARRKVDEDVKVCVPRTPARP
mmetsp:Transcript_105816/g.192947  ORF Transcript_105816/g.192947 Transcript_105816/m.192947 type:complete len:126 (+) Transcript_105816:791-1168(+)